MTFEQRKTPIVSVGAASDRPHTYHVWPW